MLLPGVKVMAIPCFSLILLGRPILGSRWDSGV